MICIHAVVLTLLIRSAYAKSCINQTIPVTLSVQNGVYNIATPQTNLDATAFVLNFTQQGRIFPMTAFQGYQTINGTFNISTQFCRPDSGYTSNPVVQVLTHGIGFDKTYWDISYNNYDYSYVDVATDGYKYCTLAYDRLGIGNSSHGVDPLNEIQAFIEIGTLYELTTMLRAGTFPGVREAFKKVVHVGHSFGAAQTYGLVAMHPHASDGIVLTGFSMNASFVGLFFAGGNFVQANQNTPRFAAYPNGYLASSDSSANEYLFLLPGYFDPQIVTVAEATKQPVTVGELLTLGSAPAINPYTGPVLVITGDSDLPYCGGNCLATGNPALASIPATVINNFPNISKDNFEVYIQPHTGHGMNYHYNATAGYNVIEKFLAAHGLQSC